MLFTQGKDREYECLMQQKPNFEYGNKKRIKFATAEDKDCPYCLYFNDKTKKCDMPNCIVFDE